MERKLRHTYLTRSREGRPEEAGTRAIFCPTFHYSSVQPTVLSTTTCYDDNVGAVIRQANRGEEKTSVEMSIVEKATGYGK